MKKPTVKKVEDEKIDVYDDALMVSLGLRQPDYEIPIFTKSKKEKALLRKLKRSANDIPRNWYSYEEPSFPLETKIIVRLKRNESYPKSTYSRKLWQYQIENYLNSFRSKKGNSLVVSYTWNGKTYKMGELPVNPYTCHKKK